LENGSRKIGLRVVAGMLLAVTIIVAVFASGISFPNQEKVEVGRLMVLLKDAPVPIDKLWINMTGLEIHKAGEGEEPGEWISLWEEGQGILFDLLEYQGNETLKLTDVPIDFGNYTKIRMNVTEAWKNYVLPENNLTVPSGKIDVITKFEIDDYDYVYVLIDMQPDWVAISKSGNLRPVLKASIFEQEPPPPSPETTT
jgi:hypothetical protein